jgi:8-oxo-dGTP diphosphatase
MNECPDLPNADKNLPLLWVVAACLIDADGRILMAQRPEGKSMAGLWEFPGGKIESGESPENALVRELYEELGIETHRSCLSPLTFASHPYEKFHLVMPVFAIRKWSGAVQSCEGQALKWVLPHELLQLAMPPADIPVAGLLQSLL